MSTHFQNMVKTEKESTLRWLFSTTRPLTPGELRFRKHGYYRAAFLMVMAGYFVYCNPEYSYLYTYYRKHKGWTDETPSVFPQYLKMVKEPAKAVAEVTAASQTTALDPVEHGAAAERSSSKK